MKKLILFAAFFVLFAVPVLAQKPNTPPLTLDVIPDYEPEGWKEYSFPADNVHFKFPVEPTVAADPSPGVVSHRVYSHTSFMDFQLLVINAASLNFEDDAPTRLNEARDGALKDLAELDSKTVKEQDVTVDGHPGRFVRAETTDGILLRIKVFLYKTRMYVALATVKKGQRHGTNWENDFEIPAMGFFDSIHLINK